MSSRRWRRPAAALTGALLLLGAVSAAPALAATSQTAVTGTQIQSLPFLGSGDVGGAGTGTPGTAASNARVASACNGGAQLYGAQWHLLPRAAVGRVVARVDAPYYPRGVDQNPSGVAFVDATTGAVVSCGAAPVTTSSRRPLAVVAYYSASVADCVPGEWCAEGALRLYVGTTTGRAPANDHWQQARTIRSLPYTGYADTSMADDDGPAVVDYETCQLSAIAPHQLATTWWRYTPRVTGPLDVSVEARTPWNLTAPYGPAYNPRATVALLTSDGPIPAPRTDPDDCDSPTVLTAGRTYLIAVHTFQDDYYDSTLVAGGPVVLRVGQVAAPGVPRAAVVSVDGRASRATLRWSPPAEAGSSAVTGYVLRAQRRLPAGLWVTTSTRVLPGTARSATARLLRGTVQRVSVQAVNRSGRGPSASALAAPAVDVRGGR